MAIVSLKLDPLAVANLERERALLDCASIDEVLEARILEGLQRIRIGAIEEFDWRPLHSSNLPTSVQLEDFLTEALTLSAVEIGFAVDVVAGAFATSDRCKPPELVRQEVEAALRFKAQRPSRILRTEPGRGNIYDAYFELPGYQLAFLTLLSGRDVSQSHVLEHAFLALATEVCSSNSIAGRPVSSEALHLASRMLLLANQKRRPSRARPRRHARADNPIE